jgi:hypothetical protein
MRVLFHLFTGGRPVEHKLQTPLVFSIDQEVMDYTETYQKKKKNGPQ